MNENERGMYQLLALWCQWAASGAARARDLYPPAAMRDEFYWPNQRSFAWPNVRDHCQ
jgi:hypothetical protein